MRLLVVLGFAAGILMSTAAKVNAETCAQTLLQSPEDMLYADLQIAPSQEQQIESIRSSAERQRAQLRSEISRVQVELGQTDNVAQIEFLENQQLALMQRLADLNFAEESSVVGLLTPWQQSQCNGDEQAMDITSAPVMVTVPTPVSFYRPGFVRRPFPHRRHFAPPTVRRPIYYPAPVGPHRPPYYAPAPAQHPIVASGHFVPSRPSTVHFPAPAHHPRFQQAPAAPTGNHRRHF